MVSFDENIVMATAATDFLEQGEMIKIAAEYSRNSLIDIIAPYLIHRQSVARRLLEHHYDPQNRAILIEMLNECNKLISELMGLQVPKKMF